MVLHLFLLHSEKLVLLTMVLNINFQTHQQWFPAMLDWAMVLWFIINQLSAYWKWSCIIKVIFICVNSSQKPKVASLPGCSMTSWKPCHFSMPHLISKCGIIIIPFLSKLLHIALDSCLVSSLLKNSVTSFDRWNSSGLKNHHFEQLF